jgi:glutaredoxin-like protein NrdH
MAVTVYSKPDCPQCHMTHKALDKHGIPYDTVDVTQDKDAYDYVMGLGYNSAPIVVVDDDNHWSGFRPERIRSLSG